MLGEFRKTAYPFKIIRTSSDVELDPSSTSFTKIVIYMRSSQWHFEGL